MGVAASIIVQMTTYPLDVVKLLQQDPRSTKRCDQVAIALFQKEGLCGFYKGIVPRMIEVSQKQIWCWPLITKLPPFFKKCGYNEPEQQALTGLTIATMDAFLGTPFDSLKLRAIYGLKRKVSWRGFPTNFAKRIVGWTTFLIAQNHFSNKLTCGKRLSLLQSIFVAWHTAIAVSLTQAPFDVLNTLRQTDNVLQVKFSIPFIRRMYRGWPLSFTALMIQNLSSVILIDRLK